MPGEAGQDAAASLQFNLLFGEVKRVVVLVPVSGTGDFMSALENCIDPVRVLLGDDAGNAPRAANLQIRQGIQ
ncbi:hypothetical protein D3C81_2033970 [compost metagenome]